MVIFTDGFRDAADGQGRPLGEAGIAERLVGRVHLSADRLATLVRKTLEAHAASPVRDDRTVLIIKRTQA